ncbi:phage major capsid protein, HK97 family [Candidatus Methanoperedens nitroreducens]|uniref:Phage major capsid protein, HK97 family n=1 Tax=Candidatus Methanoperedens nitratireducens TaxID=1392998 RepID=A0A062V887_9EURY|nr:phage major capsid protein [Candidatus Methanoperedens nitroreducens]KCZ71600.1 phage major capsid protein, HK97 family [Candidatus Methanoperedens nitroreducens]MDJ1421230.1 phage major capsid protein [Candidatus Methanoperedens sp.]
MKEINIEPMQHRSVNAGQDRHVRLLAQLLEIARIDHAGERLGSKRRRDIIRRLPVEMGASKVDDFMSDDPTAPRYQARELLLTDAIESTSIIQEEVMRTVVAGAEKFKVIRDAGVAWYPCKSNALRVPLGETERNADVVPEGAEIPDRTQDYGYRDFTIVKYGVKPRISFEMIEDGLVDVVAEEIYYAGAAVENRLNYDALTALATNAGNVTTITGGATPGTALSVLRQAKKLNKNDGFFSDTIIMHSDFEADLMANTVLQTPYYAGGPGASGTIQGVLPTPLLGMRWFVTDNGSSTVDGSYPWEYNSNTDTGAIVLEAKRGCGVAMRRDRTVNRIDDIVRELHTITVTMRCDVNYLHANAVARCKWLT